MSAMSSYSSCACCGKAVKKKVVWQCSGCQSVTYCTKRCLTADRTRHSVECSSSKDNNSNKKAGTGYGGGQEDERQRAAGRKQAAQRETKVWAEWQRELKAFCSDHANTKQKKKHPATKTNNNDDSNNNNNNNNNSTAVLNTLKQVLRCQAPDWWWNEPQRTLYDTALNVCEVLTEHYPKAWGDPEDKDDESVIAALEELAQTSQLLAKQLKGNDDDDDDDDDNDESKQQTTTIASSIAASLFHRKSKSDKDKDKDQDASLPLRVMKVRQQALEALRKVVDRPDCSMMDSGGYYRQELRPLAFDMVEQPFDRPPHHYHYNTTTTTNAAADENSAYTSSLPIPSFMRSKKRKQTKTTKTKNKNEAPKPSAHSLWKELSTYPTALPIEYGSSIFVRAQEGQMDLLRVLIIGPDDTPYANGAFMFDVSLGQDYPHFPPQVQFLTTSSFLSANDQKVRFNPNLYNDGKVCLSLLGTWQGPGWQPGESTLLQVLVSIQSLILGTAEPYFNEPGYEQSQGTAPGKTQSDNYNRKIRQYTLRAAILPFLQNELNHHQTQQLQKKTSEDDKDPPGANETNTSNNNKNKVYFAEFADVLRKHFRLKQRVIQKQLFQWYQDDPSLEGLYSEYWNIWDQLQDASSSAKGGGKKKKQKKQKPAAREEGKRRKREAPPGVKQNADGVIEIEMDDDNDDDDYDDDDNGKAQKLSPVAEQQKEPELSNRHSKVAAGVDGEEAKKHGPMEPSGVTQHTDGIIELYDDDDDDDAQLALAIHNSVSDQGYKQQQEQQQHILAHGGGAASNGMPQDGEEEKEEEEDRKPAAVDTNVTGDSNTQHSEVRSLDSLAHVPAAAAAAAKAVDVVDLT